MKKDGTPKKSDICRANKEAAILAELPGTQKAIRDATGLVKSTLQGILAEMVKEEKIYVIHGEKWTESTYHAGGYIRRQSEPIKAPVTQYHTRWVGGRYPGSQYAWL